MAFQSLRGLPPEVKRQIRQQKKWEERGRPRLVHDNAQGVKDAKQGVPYVNLDKRRNGK